MERPHKRLFFFATFIANSVPPAQYLHGIMIQTGTGDEPARLSGWASSGCKPRLTRPVQTERGHILMEQIPDDKHHYPADRGS